MSNTMHTFEKNGKTEQVPLERWYWEVTYTDSTVLKQFGDDGIFHQFGEIDQSRLSVFAMVNAETGQRIDIPYRDGMKLIHYYDNYTFAAFTEEETRCRVCCFGYENKETNEKLIISTLPNDQIVIGEINLEGAVE